MRTGGTYANKGGEAGVRCRIGDFTVALRSEHRGISQEFAALYPPASTEDLDSGVIHVEVKRSGRSRVGRRLYSVVADGEEVGGPHSANGVFPFVEWAINLRVIARAPEYLQLHAASMVHRRSAFIFPGHSGCGKSTLAAMLLARGWQYLCDEFALIDKRTLSAHPFPKALCIKAGSYDIVRRSGLSFARRRDYLKAHKGRVGYIRPTAIGEPAPVRFIIFPEYRAAVPPQLRPLPRARAALELRRFCFNSGIADEAIPIIAKLVEQASCFSLSSGDAHRTCELLETLLDDNERHSLSNVTSPFVGDADCASAPPMRGGAAWTTGRVPTRREALRVGATLAYVAPAVLTLSARDAFAAGSNPSDVCSTGVHTGGLCETDADCCSRRCNLGVCASNQ